MISHYTRMAAYTHLRVKILQLFKKYENLNSQQTFSEKMYQT